VSGAPVLNDALGWVECRVISSLPAGDHTIVLGEVVAAGVESQGKALSLQDAGFNYSG
jgi:flavin reductase (DIM6/NTAB) family NADH-FMN oxidoreductase RutF